MLAGAFLQPLLLLPAAGAVALHVIGYRSFYRLAVTCGGYRFALPALAFELALDAAAGIAYGFGRLRGLISGPPPFHSRLADAQAR